MNLLLPKTYVKDTSKPIFYLAGPIRGADDWQRHAASCLDRATGKNCIIVNPSRYDGDHPLYKEKMEGRSDRFVRQVDWERHYMWLAATGTQGGCLIFWLPTESKINPRPKEEGPYAQDTYGELGYWRSLMRCNRLHTNMPMRVVFGADREFPGLDVFQRQLNLDLRDGDPVQIYPSLHETLQRAVTVSTLSSSY